MARARCQFQSGRQAFRRTTRNSGAGQECVLPLHPNLRPLMPFHQASANDFPNLNAPRAAKKDAPWPRLVDRQRLQPRWPPPEVACEGVRFQVPPPGAIAIHWRAGFQASPILVANFPRVT